MATSLYHFCGTWLCVWRRCMWSETISRLFSPSYSSHLYQAIGQQQHEGGRAGGGGRRRKSSLKTYVIWSSLKRRECSDNLLITSNTGVKHYYDGSFPDSRVVFSLFMPRLTRCTVRLGICSFPELSQFILVAYPRRIFITEANLSPPPPKKEVCIVLADSLGGMTGGQDSQCSPRRCQDSKKRPCKKFCSPELSLPVLHIFAVLDRPEPLLGKIFQDPIW